MSLAVSSQPQPLQLSPVNRVILIAGGWQNLKLAEDLREEIEQSGWDCEIFWGDVTDSTQVGKLVHDVLDCCHHVNLLVNNAGTPRDRSIRKMTDEEWLAQ